MEIFSFDLTFLLGLIAAIAAVIAATSCHRPFLIGPYQYRRNNCRVFDVRFATTWPNCRVNSISVEGFEIALVGTIQEIKAPEQFHPYLGALDFHSEIPLSLVTSPNNLEFSFVLVGIPSSPTPPDRPEISVKYKRSFFSWTLRGRPAS